MLPKSKRFSKEDFQGKRPRVFFRGELFDVATSDLPSPIRKIACVTSKKTLKRAVDRNLIKRRIMSIIQEKERGEGASLIFYPKKISVTVPYAILHKEIEKTFATLER